MHYAAVLNEYSLAGEIVDNLRATTDASLDVCIEAAKNVARLIGQYVSDEDFKRIEYALKNYTVNVDDCYDRKLLDQLVIRLDDIFREKEQLSYSILQDDYNLIECLRTFSDTVRKTDARIPLAIFSEVDYRWLGQLVALFQMDQSRDVKMAALSCIDCLAERCGQSISAFLIDNKLSIVLANQMPNSGPLNELQLCGLKLLTRIFSFSLSPPLEHFEYFTSEFFLKLIALMEFHPREAIDLMVNFSAVCSQIDSDPIIVALEKDCRPEFSPVFIKMINKGCSVRRLEFFIKITKRGDDLLHSIFYMNDLKVMTHVVARELINNESLQVRELCLSAIEQLVCLGLKDEEMVEAVASCTLPVPQSLQEQLQIPIR
ncbi:hypothetical protein WR25_25153 [Diploscapter pachys]|uniref:SPIN90/Ldb17 leucine-rich domain-containing protein n=1 Tax=Diploscapter pachys TaxID=2018661 RepID=A0A2A2LWH2_9BILA|nr:hypothetical protein WR25_25153 [Diploscapter pachys]